MPSEYKRIAGLIARLMRSLLLTLMAFLCVPSALAAEDGVLWLTPGRDRTSISPYLQVLEDPDGNLTVQDVSSPPHAQRFRRVRGEGVRSGLTEPTVYWLRLTYALGDAGAEPEAYYFDLGQITKVFATLYAPATSTEGNPAWKAQGPLNRFGQAVDQPRQFTHFSLPPPTTRPQTVFLRAQIPLSLEAMPEIVTRAGFQRRLLGRDLFSGALLGIFAILALNNLIIFLTLRYAGYLWYALLLLAFSLQVMFLGGLFQDFAPQTWLNQVTGAPVMAMGLVTLARFLFIRSFLPLKTYFPLGDRLILAMMVLYLPLIAWPFVWPTFLLMVRGYAAVSLLGVLFAMYAGVVCWRKGYAPARFFLLAYLPEMVGSFVMFIGYFGLWWPLPLTTFQVQQIGIAIEAVLLSLALVQRVNALRLERERITREAQGQTEEHQRRLRGLAGELVRSEERQRKALADDLHDGISQNLATSLFNLRLLASRGQGVDSSPPLSEVCDLLRSTLEQTRTLTFDISPPVLHDYGLEAGLEWLAERFQERHGLAISYRAEGSLPGRDEGLEVNLFRAVQELLSNVVKHASSSRAEVTLACRGNQVSVRVSDDGRGMAGVPEQRRGPGGFGLFSIRERMQALGGGVDIESSPGQGTTITLRAPWPEEKFFSPQGIPDEDDHTAGR